MSLICPVLNAVAVCVEIVDGPLAELFSRAVVVVDENGKVIYTQQVPEIVDEPNYDEVLAALK